jgi:uncharacterized Zn finger protein
MGHRDPVYTTRERVKAAAGFTELTDSLIDRAIRTASRLIEGQCHRKFYPQSATRVFDWPPPQTSRSWRLWLDQNDLISVTSITIAGTGQTVGNFNLEPANDGPPYDSIEVDLSTSASFTAGDTHQQSVSIVGFWGWDNVKDSAGTTAEDMTTSETDLSVTNGGLFGVGDLLTIGAERVLVEEIEFEDTAVNTDGTVSAQVNDTTIPTADESGNVVGETIRINDEQMLITSITTGNLNVLRAQNGTALAAHGSGDDIYANRLVTLERAVTGTSAVATSSGEAISKQVYQPLIEQWCTAEAIVNLAQQSAAYARTAGAADNERETIGRGLVDLREMALALHGRRVRTAAV